MQEVQNFMDDGSKKKYAGDAEEVDEKRKTEFKKKKVKEDWWYFLNKEKPICLCKPKAHFLKLK